MVLLNNFRDVPRLEVDPHFGTHADLVQAASRRWCVRGATDLTSLHWGAFISQGYPPVRCCLCTALWRQRNLDDHTGKMSNVRVSFKIGGL